VSRKENQQYFRELLVDSILDVQAVARYFAANPDVDVIVNETRIASEIGNSISGADQGDMRIRIKGGDWKTVEVKGTKWDAESLRTFKYLNVDWVDKYDQKEHMVDFYCMVTADRTSFFIHNHKLRAGLMEVQKIRDPVCDKVTGVPKDIYHLPQIYWQEKEVPKPNKEVAKCSDS